MARINKAQQNLSLPVDVVETLRNLSAFRKFKGVESATMADIVNDALTDYFSTHSAEISKAKLLLADDDNETQKNAVQIDSQKTKTPKNTNDKEISLPLADKGR